MASEGQQSLKELKYQRGRIKSGITRFNAYIDNIKEQEPLDMGQIMSRLAKVKDSWSEFQVIHAKISTTEDDQNSTIEADEFEDSYFNVLGKVENLLQLYSHNKTDNKSQNKQSIGNSLPGDENYANCMPKISLPSFSGDLEEWMPFYQMFQSVVESNKSLSTVQKFHFLRSALKGDAAECIQHLLITTENYENAWVTLKERYNNKRFHIKKHILGIQELPQLAHGNLLALKQLVNGLQSHVRALKALDRPTEHWDDWLVCVVSNKFDHATKIEWEAKFKITEIPTFEDLTDFLTHKLTTFESVKSGTSSKSQKSAKPASLAHTSSEGRTCFICKGEHYIFACQKFQHMTAQQRIKQVRSAKLCLNCLRPGHQASKCNSGNCKECGSKHNTLLHIVQANDSKAAARPESSSESPSSEHVVAHSAQLQSETVLLSTARILIKDSRGRFHTCVALLDSGSQSNFLSKSLATKLGLKMETVSIPVVGISQIQTKITKSASIHIQSNCNSYSAQLNCLVLDSITNVIPAERISKHQLNIPSNLKLADPEFNIPKRIDLLIGAQLFWHLLCIGQVKIPNTHIIMQKTHFGWVISGSLKNTVCTMSSTICNLSIDQELDATLKRFWELEEVPASMQYTTEELACENHFVKTHRRNTDGRFVVQLPLKDDPAMSLGDSREAAVKRFYSLERKFNKQPCLKKQYQDFIEEYMELDHMQSAGETTTGETFYLPHHAVIKQESVTTKLRVVFDGSAKTATGYSLNDILMVGPTVQQDLFSIVCRFRTHKIVITGDVTKMYRQVWVDPQHTRFQRIIWRSDPTKELQTYELKTVTYGTASASFLATRCLKQLALEAENVFPIGAQTIKTDFYVDDLLTGTNTEEEIEMKFNEVNAILSQGGFTLRKWACNHPKILSKLLPGAVSPVVLDLDGHSNLKTLGVQWNSHTDTFQYSVSFATRTGRITKRTILSQVAQVFDPLGLAGPVSVKAKMFIQNLWQLKISWDESLPVALHTEWCEYQSNYEALNSVVINRHVLPYNEWIELHGFCDASERAYGACVYVRCVNREGDIASNLLCSRSRVAPLKMTTIPRLELCAALLLAQLVEKVRHILHVRIDAIHYWTDSTIALAWINTTSRHLKTFVSNRVAQIQELSDISNWSQVNTKENPADLLSRGLNPQLLIDHQLWWKGPEWLLLQQTHWPQRTCSLAPDEIPETRPPNVISNVTTMHCDLINRYSQLTRLERIVAWCLRFTHNLQMRIQGRPMDSRSKGLTPSEINSALLALVRVVQTEIFSDEQRSLASEKVVKPSSKLRSLNPFIDPQDLIRLGGRIGLSSHTSYEERHPLILPPKHRFTKLLIEKVHQSELHAGTQATLAKIRRNFWPLSGRSTVRQVIRNCITCFKANPTVHQPLMGNLPKERIEPARPFINVGVDYCGPFLIRDGKRKNAPKCKAYIAIFICMAVKAVHIEVVTSLDADSFISALKRFIARRGMISNIHSDNGTNFIRANKELEELRKMFIEESSHTKISDFLADQKIQWHFSPPRAPHFGGIWEAAVKSFKYHYKRVVGNALLNYEEICTITSQIESILNSRPLLPLSEDPSDLSILTPGHFLIGDSLRANLEPDLTTLQTNRLSRLQMLEKLKQHFWQRWSREYLQQLQQRSKWSKHSPGILQEGQMVLIKEDHTPPCLWPLGRISALYPGQDHIIRVAKVKTVRGEVKRAVNKLCILPIAN